MKKLMRKTIAAFMMFVMILCSAAFAQNVETASEAAPAQADLLCEPFALEARIGGRVYDFACTLEELEEQGVRIAQDKLEAGKWHRANNGRASFGVLLQGTKGDESELSVCGLQAKPDGNQVFELPGGILIGKSTLDDCIAAWGEAETHAQYWQDFCRGKVQFRVYYDENELITNFEMISHGPLSWGFDFDGQAGTVQEELPDPTQMNFDEYIIDGKLYEGQIMLSDLEKNGWVLDHSEDLNEIIEPQADKWLVCNTVLVLGNGESTLEVHPVNRSAEKECPLGECGVMYIGVSEEDNVSVVLADGLTLGSRYSDVEALFGTAQTVNTQAEEDRVFYEHEVMGSVRYGFWVKDGIVEYIRIRP